ncbi:hypothetical protein BUALT_Bualt13G0026700 [Buddleja alternifolia]|uniref:Uncharacterized protein n=1 Tax=Buddleja alternifolia TaxID=168488 RepID=A0AAV6WL92_9LAMI|nr:hypothetical protein BUALT_Bualt13G0026700 [Buddleja alternifolia]
MRRRCKLRTEYPPLTIAPGDASRNRGSDKPFDMRKAKRVRFADSEVDGVPDYVSSRGHKANQSPRSDAPKTSEYAYYRKLKNGAANSHCSSLHKESKEVKSSKLSREAISASDMLKPRRDFKFSISGESERPSDHRVFFSPLVSKHEEPDQLRRKDQTNKTKKMPSSLPENITPVGQSLYSSPLNEASGKSGLAGNQHTDKGIFSAKRDRLRQWVAHTLFPEVDKLPPKGFDLVSSLLSRLLPKGNKNDDSSKGDADNNSKSLILHESSYLENGIHLSHTTDWDNDLLKISSSTSSEIVLSERDTYLCKFTFPSYATETHFQDELIDLDERSKSRISRNSHTQHGFSFCLPFERYKPSGCYHLKEQDEFYYPTEHERKEPNRLLLEWDFKSRQATVSSSNINHVTAKNLCPRLATSWNVDNVLDTEGLYSSSLEFNSIPNYCSTSYLTQNIGPSFEDMKCADAEQEHFSPALPCTPKCITLAEDRNAENLLYTNNIIFSYRDLHWLDNKLWDADRESEFWQQSLSASDFFAEGHFPQYNESLYSFPRVEEATGEPFTPLSEGAFNNHFLSSNFQASLDTLITRPLLLDNVSQFKPTKELYFDDDDDDNELEYS